MGMEIWGNDGKSHRFLTTSTHPNHWYVSCRFPSNLRNMYSPSYSSFHNRSRSLQLAGLPPTIDQTFAIVLYIRWAATYIYQAYIVPCGLCSYVADRLPAINHASSAKEKADMSLCRTLLSQLACNQVLLFMFAVRVEHLVKSEYTMINTSLEVCFEPPLDRSLPPQGWRQHWLW